LEGLKGIGLIENVEQDDPFQITQRGHGFSKMGQRRYGAKILIFPVRKARSSKAS